VVDECLAPAARDGSSSEDGICSGPLDVQMLAREPAHVGAESFFDSRHCDDEFDGGCCDQGGEQLIHKLDRWAISTERLERFTEEIERGIRIGSQQKTTENYLTSGISVE
jgi:hypothetical protein